MRKQVQLTMSLLTQRNIVLFVSCETFATCWF